MQIHPILVHLPIAASWLGLGFELWSRLRDREESLWASDAVVLLGSLGAIAAVVSGKLVEEAVEDIPGIHDVFETHERLGYVAAAMYLLVLGYRIWCRRRGGDALAGWGRLVSAFVLVALTGATGFFGGKLVYEHGAGVAPMTTPVGTSAPHEHDEESRDGEAHEAGADSSEREAVPPGATVSQPVEADETGEAEDAGEPPSATGDATTSM